MNRALLVALVALSVVACGRDETMAERGGQPLVVYASHNATETAAVLESYRSRTGQRFRLLTDDMAETDVRLGNSAMMPEADLFLAASLAEIWAAAEADALRPVFSADVDSAVAAWLRDPEARWIALSRRARVVVRNTASVGSTDLASLQDYAGLQGERWKGRLCVSSSSVPGNRALVAHLIRRHGVREAELIVRGWRANLAMTVFTNDGTLLNAIADGRCGIGIVDSSVLAAFLTSVPDAPVLAHWFADAANVLVDISAAAVTRHAGQPEQAQALLEWLASPEPNGLYADLRFEFPVNAAAPVNAIGVSWTGGLPPDAPLPELGFLLEEADLLIERARYP